jgi:hypothetical protein
MSGEGVKEIHRQMERELEELRSEAGRTDGSCHEESWEPPSLERIRRRMGTAT